MRVLSDGSLRIRVRIRGIYEGKPFVFVDAKCDEGSQSYWPDAIDPSIYEASEYWWSEGNGSCDCNRCEYVGIDEMECGDTIFIDSIEPIETCAYDLPILYLNESKEG